MSLPQQTDREKPTSIDAALQSMIDKHPQCALIFSINADGNFSLCCFGSAADLVALHDIGSESLQDMLRKVVITQGNQVH